MCPEGSQWVGKMLQRIYFLLLSHIFSSPKQLLMNKNLTFQPIKSEKKKKKMETQTLRSVVVGDRYWTTQTWFWMIDGHVMDEERLRLVVVGDSGCKIATTILKVLEVAKLRLIQDKEIKMVTRTRWQRRGCGVEFRVGVFRWSMIVARWVTMV